MKDNYDFSQAKQAKDVDHLTKLRKTAGSKSRISIMLDNDVIGHFKALAQQQNIGYQTLINQALRSMMNHQPLDEGILRKVIREELSSVESTE